MKHNRGARFFPGKDPCSCCVNAGRCDEICWHRARWWDVQMKKIRASLKGAGNGLETGSGGAAAKL